MNFSLLAVRGSRRSPGVGCRRGACVETDSGCLRASRTDERESCRSPAVAGRGDDQGRQRRANARARVGPDALSGCNRSTAIAFRFPRRLRRNCTAGARGNFGSAGGDARKERGQRRQEEKEEGDQNHPPNLSPARKACVRDRSVQHGKSAPEPMDAGKFSFGEAGYTVEKPPGFGGGPGPRQTKFPGRFLAQMCLDPLNHGAAPN